MRMSAQHPGNAVIFATLLLPYLAASSGSFDCNQIRVDGKDFDLHELGGPRTAVETITNPASTQNTSYTVDICKPLKKVKGIKDELQCPNGSRICAITRFIVGDDRQVTDVFPVAGDLRDKGGFDMDAKWTRLKNHPTNADPEKEGLVAEINGGFKLVNKDRRKQKAIINFVCDKSRTGLENLPDALQDQYTEDKLKRDGGDAVDGTPSLEFLQYKEEDGVDVLRLKWRTSHACEDAKEGEDKKKSQSWGFFTWFIIIAFLATAAYLIYAAFINHQRHGARGWDMLPHRDTIMDVPYLLKDWMRRVLSSIQGGGSRGGYAAV